MAESCDTIIDDCTGEDICLVGTCEPAFGRTYELSIGDVEVFTDWDPTPGFEAPDVSVGVLLNGESVLDTNEQLDTYQPVFSERASLVVPAGARLQIALLDGDIDGFETIINCVADPLTADFLRAGGLSSRTQMPTPSFASLHAKSRIRRATSVGAACAFATAESAHVS